ncbi:DUF4214 domain-containing protein [Pseudomonas gessardii]|uniref:DUF4214 domain-containing protein n=1 Tax=Pseudomonas gessardii TaxID=78544 RepID=A0ABS9FC03_9PSED|nr:DUF4214 domain-containing protein [Pseudomonas gessardii]MCF4982116.1 DUF4214 domain-containing protein [Pseudomonas gessardii]MCF4990282.1 DUF4214 domain-containing protein [Pseudomonas gessardii]MCF5084171.1 DUF4214 domain-containing protein [Pseudomonas gessardii]MCF5096630.1 DUF4214 domain-containing protein [Pseudomonas gessardii]MCF5109832.1 DUF4214 domain-containing protein [Pseudomonas gessardii]
MATTTATQIQQLYVGLLGRAADQGGLNWWADQVTTGGKTLEDVRASFVTSTEYTTTYGAAATRADLVTSIYQNLFERTPSADEVKYWAETDTRPADQLVAAFIEFAGAADQAVINNKTFVAQTYTDTVGTNFNAAGAASVIANVDGTPASVSTAISNISNGTLTGLVPGVALINALAVANADKVAYGVTAAASNTTFDANKDGVVTAAEAKDAFDTANTARFTGVSSKSTADLTADVNTKTTELAAAKLAVTAVTGGSAAVAAYDTAVAAQKTLIGNVTAAAAKTAAEGVTAAVKASIDVAVPATATGTAVSFATLSQAFAGNATAITDGDSLIIALKTPGTDTASITAHTKLVTELAKVTTFGAQLTAAVDKELALIKAAGDVTSAENTLKVIDNSLTASVVEGADYISKAVAQTSANDLLVKAQAADATLNTAKVVVDKYTSLDTAILSSKTAINNFVAANADKVTITDISGGTSVQATAKADVFYFANKATTTDFSIGGTNNFGTGDSIVLGSGYTFNSGALSTGNSNTLEFFLVKSTTGTQVVIENDAFGNSNTVVGADGNITASPNATVINLVGVTADHLSVANGVVSYV